MGNGLVQTFHEETFQLSQSEGSHGTLLITDESNNHQQSSRIMNLRSRSLTISLLPEVHTSGGTKSVAAYSNMKSGMPSNQFTHLITNVLMDSVCQSWFIVERIFDEGNQGTNVPRAAPAAVLSSTEVFFKRFMTILQDIDKDERIYPKFAVLPSSSRSSPSSSSSSSTVLPPRQPTSRFLVMIRFMLETNTSFSFLKRLRQVGREHARIGVTNQDMKHFAESFISTMMNVLQIPGTKCSIKLISEMMRAWRVLFHFVIEEMGLETITCVRKENEK